MKLPRAFSAELRRKIGHPHALLIPDEEPQWRPASQSYYQVPSSIDELFADNATLARAMGFGTAESVRGNARARQRRTSFMGRARHWRAGRQSPGRAWLPRMQRAARDEQRRRATPRTVAGVVELMLTYGITVGRFDFYDSYDDRDRDVDVEVFIAPELLTASGFGAAFAGGRPKWAQAAAAFVEAWSTAYSGDENLFPPDNIDDVEVLSFRLGRSPDADYDYRREAA